MERAMGPWRNGPPSRRFISAMIQGRSDIYTASRIVIKAGTSVVSTPDGYPSLSRIANIVENAARLAKEGKQVMIVTSGTRQSL